MTTTKKQQEFDPNFWGKLDSVQKFYYLGFMTADACVYHNSVTVDLSIRDYSWLESYRRSLGIDSKISIRDQNPTRNSISASVRKTCKQWVDDLSQYSLVAQKTGHEHLPYEYCTSVKEVAALTLGYMDGDCSIYKKATDRYYLNVLGNKHVVTQVADVLHKYVEIESNSFVPDRRTTNIYTMSFGAKSDLIDIYNFLYKTNPELESCWLGRKHDKFSSFIIDKCVDTYMLCSATGVCV